MFVWDILPHVARTPVSAAVGFFLLPLGFAALDRRSAADEIETREREKEGRRETQSNTWLCNTQWSLDICHFFMC